MSDWEGWDACGMDEYLIERNRCMEAIRKSMGWSRANSEQYMLYWVLRFAEAHPHQLREWVDAEMERNATLPKEEER